MYIPELHYLFLPFVDITEVIDHGNSFAPHPETVVLSLAVFVQFVGTDGTAGHGVVVKSAHKHDIYYKKKQKICLCKNI